MTLPPHRRALCCTLAPRRRLTPRPLVLGGLLLAALPLAVPPPALAQAPPDKSTLPREANATSSPSEQSEVPDVPGLSLPDGWNAGLTIAGIHDSAVGWATLATPAVGYSFNDIFSIDATIPIYFYRLAPSRAARIRANQQLVNQRGEPGDLILGFHAQFVPDLFQYQATVSVALPSGDEPYGLTTGRVTFDLSNHFERSFGRWTPTLELGAGDNTTLINRLVNKNYTSLGPLAHFQAGLGVQLMRGLSFESDAYEQLPIGDQKIYGPSRKGRPTIVTGHNVTEDNGFTNSLDIPIDRHTTLSGYYNRSLRFRTDTVAFGITYVLRGAPPPPEAVIDDLLR